MVRGSSKVNTGEKGKETKLGTGFVLWEEVRAQAVWLTALVLCLLDGAPELGHHHLKASQTKVQCMYLTSESSWCGKCPVCLSLRSSGAEKGQKKSLAHQ